VAATDFRYLDDEAYVYDDNGNRVTANGSTCVTGADNQLLSDGIYRYTYDAEENRTAKFVDTDADGVLDSGDTDVSTYTWDYRNRLTEVEHFDAYGESSDLTVDYVYDWANRLVSRTLDADGAGGSGDIQRSIYAYDGDQVALQFDKTYANGSARDLAATDFSHRYLWNPQSVDQLFADEQVHYDDGEEEFVTDRTLWALVDHLNSVRDLAAYDSGTDTTTIANHRVYDSYGNLKSEANAAVDCLFGYTGRQYDTATDLQNNLNRWYDPSVGRWVSQDPIGFAGRDANLYRYVGNNSAVYVDPSGAIPDGLMVQIQEANRREKPQPTWLDRKLGKLEQAPRAIYNGAGWWACFDACFLIGREATRFGNEWASFDIPETASWSNAARHAYWQAALTAKYGPDVAKAIGDAHERGENCSRDSRIDQFNNAVARRIAKGLKLSEIEGAIIKALLEGEFITSYSDPRIPPPGPGLIY
jgi:RHS repeat-associated protein